VELAETILKVHKDLPRAKTPHERETIQRQIAAPVYEMYGLAEDVVRIVEGCESR